MGQSGNPAKRAASRKARQASEHMKLSDDQESVALYHVMREDDDFESTADRLFQIVKEAARLQPGKRRVLFLDVEGHRNSAGGYDADAFEIMKEFITGFLGPWLSEMHTPLVDATRTDAQREDLPQTLFTIEVGEGMDRGDDLRAQGDALGMPTYDADTGEWISAKGEDEED